MIQFLVPLIFAAAGAAAGAISTKQKEKRELDTLEYQKKQVWKQYQLGKDYSDQQFDIQKTKALEDIFHQKQNLDTNVGLSVDDYNTSLLSQAFGIQDARIQNESGIGASLAAEGASGTRGNEANANMRAYAAEGLERNIGIQEKQNKNQLNSLVSGANNAMGAMNRERDSWLPGGFRMQEKAANDVYNLNMAKLGQTNFDWQMDKTKATGLDYASGILGGASSGFGIGESVVGFGNNYLNFFKNQNPKGYKDASDLIFGH